MKSGKWHLTDGMELPNQKIRTLAENETYKYLGILEANTIKQVGATGSVMVSKLDLQTYTIEFVSHWVPHSYGLVPHLSKKLCKLPPSNKWKWKAKFKKNISEELENYSKQDSPAETLSKE